MSTNVLYTKQIKTSEIIISIRSVSLREQSLRYSYLKRQISILETNIRRAWTKKGAAELDAKLSKYKDEVKSLSISIRDLVKSKYGTKIPSEMTWRITWTPWLSIPLENIESDFDLWTESNVDSLPLLCLTKQLDEDQYE